MTSAIFSIDAVWPRSNTALLVEPSASDAIRVTLVLSELGFQVTVSDSFQQAKTQLTPPPALLITELRLGAYNGLHLVLRGKSIHPQLAALVTSHVEDPLLWTEAERLGATFVPKSVSPQEFRAAVLRTLFRSVEGHAEPIRRPFERRTSERRKASDGYQPDRRVSERRRNVDAKVNRDTEDRA